MDLIKDKYDRLLDEARGATAAALSAMQSIDAKCQFWIAVATALALKARADKEFVTVPAKYMLEAQKYGILVEHTATGEGAGSIHIRLEKVPDNAEQQGNGQPEPKVRRFDNFGKEIIDPPKPD
jgi:hypothetical protein